MAVANFEQIVLGLCEVLKLTPPALVPDDNGVVSVDVSLHDVDFAIAYAPAIHTDRAFVSAAYGDLPEQRELEGMRVLMETNFLLFRGNSPGFSRSPVDGAIVFQFEVLFEHASPVGLLSALEKIAEQVAQWRKDHFLDGNPVAYTNPRQTATPTSVGDFA